MNGIKLSDRIREAQKKVVEEKNNQEWKNVLDKVDTVKLAESILEDSKVYENCNFVELKFEDPRIPGFGRFLSLEKGKRSFQTVAWWKMFEINHDIRVHQSTDNLGLYFMWQKYAADGWITPTADDLLGPEYDDLQQLASKRKHQQMEINTEANNNKKQKEQL